jgi:probable phosphoglycerate mutase
MRLYLARHAQTASNIGHALDTAYPGAALTGLGNEQAERLAARLAAEPLAVVAASPLLRAQQTAAALATGRDLEVLTLDGLREVDAGDLEMQTSKEAIEGYVAVLRAWAEGDLDAAVPGGENGHEFLARFDAAVRAIEDAAGLDEAALAVSHGAAIRSWSAIRCGNVSNAADVSRHYLVNTGVVLIEGSSQSGWQLETWLEPDTPDDPFDTMITTAAE